MTGRLYDTLELSNAQHPGLMQPLYLTLIAASLYAISTAYQGRQLWRRSRPDRRIMATLGIFALTAQVACLYLQLITPYGLELNFFNAASLMAAAVILLILLAYPRMPVDNLLMLLFPLGAVTVLLAHFAPTGTSELINKQPGILAHILLSILAYGLLTIAVFQALLLLVQDHQLKHKQPSGMIRNFPPLQTMESLLFAFIWAGWGLLTLSLLSGWLYVEDLLAQHLAHKTLLSAFAWLVFAVLLWGRQQLGWRGHKAIRWTLAGFCLLMLAYFGSKLVREFILHI